MVESLAADGVTLMMVTHEMNFARKVNDHIVFMHPGKVHEAGTPDQVFGQLRTPALRQFLSAVHG